MSEQPHESELTSMRRDIDRLTHEAESLARSLNDESRLAREEVVGAELVATRDLIAHLGLAWDTASQLGDLYARQARYFVEDHVATASSFIDGSAQGRVFDVLGSHVERRVGHLTEGLSQGLELVARQSGSACALVQTLWAPYFAVVRQDWGRDRDGAPERGRDA